MQEKTAENDLVINGDDDDEFAEPNGMRTPCNAMTERAEPPLSPEMMIAGYIYTKMTTTLCRDGNSFAGIFLDIGGNVTHRS